MIEFLPFVLFLFLASLRFLGVLSSLLFFSEASMPVVVRYYLSLALAVAAYPAFGQGYFDTSILASSFTFAFSALGELLVGIILGVLASSPLYALKMAGRFISQQMGFAMAEVMDPMSEQKSSVVGQMKYLIGTWFWFYFGGHILATQGVVESVSIIPIGSPVFTLFSLSGITAWIKELFLLSMKVALPYFGVLLLTEIGLGFVAKMVPQMNIFMLGFPVKIILALIFLAILSVAVIRYLLLTELTKFMELLPLFWTQ